MIAGVVGYLADSIDNKNYSQKDIRNDLQRDLAERIDLRTGLQGLCHDSAELLSDS